MKKKEHAIGFAQWIIETLCILGVDNFCHPNDMETNINTEKAYQMYLQSNHKSA